MSVQALFLEKTRKQKLLECDGMGMVKEEQQQIKQNSSAGNSEFFDKILFSIFCKMIRALPTYQVHNSTNSIYLFRTSISFSV